MKKSISRISKNIVAKLEQGMGESSKDIKVFMKSNKSDVELSGFVDILSEKKEAEEITSTIPGVNRITNHITISTDGSISDREVEEDTNKKLRNSLYHNRLRGVTAKVSGGTAVLQGEADTVSDRKKALKQAAKGFGVKDVVNHIEVASQSDDVTIANEINRLFVTSYIDVQDVSSVIENGLVHLYGYINNPEEESNLVAITEEIDGVRRVASHLKIRDWSLE